MASRVVHKIISKRAGTTHERPYFPIAGGLVSRNKRLFFQKTDDWREGHRLLHKLIMGSDSRNHGHLAEAASLRLLHAYMDELKAWHTHHYRYAVAIKYNIVTNTPRVLVDDLEFEGYRFPAGTEFLINSIPVCSNCYERPTEFWPERWLENDVSGGGIEQGLWQLALSGEKSSCVGYKLAQKELFGALSRLLYCFDYCLAGAIDDEKLGHFGSGEPFPVKVTIRSPGDECLFVEK
ncbi:unnamed protein product [Aspergillus oryzae var. brunneus]|uniref:Unnamed protein product n=2 Tax=Aspergillus oryzae TaxID=5062 RepID=A0AAN4YSN5_ASPOZ|nr:unnamed protein product [Aspergillus oryzae]GMG41605.1 unnamed protein product [Aspergillus oryzae var. brunneus]